VDGYAVHAAMVGREIIRRENGAGNDHRVEGKPSHGMRRRKRRPGAIQAFFIGV